MTDNENIKALDNLHDRILNDKSFLAKVNHGELSALFHVKRILELQQAEIERLNIRNKALTDINKNYDWKFSKVKSEAIKEFVKRLKEQAECADMANGGTVEVIDVEDIDNLVKEMMEVSE